VSEIVCVCFGCLGFVLVHWLVSYDVLERLEEAIVSLCLCAIVKKFRDVSF